MRWILLLTGCLFLVFLPAHAGHTPPQVMLRIHVQTTGEGSSPMEVSRIQVPPDGDTILIRSIPELSEGQLIGAEQDNDGLHLQFNHVGMVNLNAATAQNQGRILVVLIDGNVIYAPVIDMQITNGQLDIPHPIPPVILQLLQEVAKENLKRDNRT
jgi:hypothetical protein